MGQLDHEELHQLGRVGHHDEDLDPDQRHVDALPGFLRFLGLPRDVPLGLGDLHLRLRRELRLQVAERAAHLLQVAVEVDRLLAHPVVAVERVADAHLGERAGQREGQHVGAKLGDRRPLHLLADHHVGGLLGRLLEGAALQERGEVRDEVAVPRLGQALLPGDVGVPRREQVAGALEARRCPVVGRGEEVGDAELPPLRRRTELVVHLGLGGQEGSGPGAVLRRADVDVVRQDHHRVGRQRLLDGRDAHAPQGLEELGQELRHREAGAGMPEPLPQRDARDVLLRRDGRRGGPVRRCHREPRRPVARAGQDGEAPVQLEHLAQLRVFPQVEGDGEDAGAVGGEEELNPW